jgi:DNA (cytosine-5)-methyltransferase 1
MAVDDDKSKRPAPASAAAAKKPPASGSKKAKTERAAAAADPDAADADEAAAAPASASGAACAVGSGRRAAQGLDFKREGAKTTDRARKADMVAVVEVAEATDEASALADTAAAAPQGSSHLRGRRLLNFAVVDGAGVPQPLDRLDVLLQKAGKPAAAAASAGKGKKAAAAATATPSAVAVAPEDELYLTGEVYPIVELATRTADREAARRVATPIGPLTGWSLELPKQGSAPAAGAAAADAPAWRIVAHTAQARYALSKPAASFKRTHAPLEEQAALAAEVVAALDAAPAASLDDVVGKLSRAKAGKALGYGTARQALLLNGRFVLRHLAAEASRRDPEGVRARAEEASRLAAALDKGKGKSAAQAAAAQRAALPVGLEACPFVEGLEAELAKGPVPVGAVSAPGALRIAADATGAAAAAADKSDAPPADAQTTADEELARRLQAKMDAEALKGTGGGRGRNAGGGGGAGGGPEGAAGKEAYVRISEEEIADDYPMPRQYSKEDEEADELALFWDEELAELADPDALPRRVLTDFSFYNNDGFYASLELLPMWSGVDPDVELYASGVVRDDDGGWEGGAGAHAALAVEAAAPAAAAAGKGKGAAAAAADGAGGSGSGAGGSGAGGSGAGGSGAGGSSAAAEAEAEDAPAAATAVATAADAAGGVRACLSQIREWVVEFSADALFISVRTDAGWYRLDKPNPRYAPWFGVPLKGARLAVKLIGMLADEPRASRLSFGEVVRRLADQPAESPTFVSKRAERVERYVVVHGQILLNQIRFFPKKEVQRAPFVAALRERMAQRRHHKLYYVKGRFRAVTRASSGVNRNPMKDRASARSAPMPATATRMVKSVWENYFEQLHEQGSATLGGKGGDGASAAAVKEEAAAAAAEAEAAALRAAAEPEEAEEEERSSEEEAEEEEAEGQGAAAAGKKGGKAAAAAAAAAAEKKKAAAAAALAAANKKAANVKVAWVGKPTAQVDGGAALGGRTLYGAAKVGSVTLKPGDVVVLPFNEVVLADGAAEDEDDEPAPGVAPASASPALGLVQALFLPRGGAGVPPPSLQVRRVRRGEHTVLGDAAGVGELFVTDEYDELPLAALASAPGAAAAGGAARVKARRLERDWDYGQRLAHFEADLAHRAAFAAEAAKPAGEADPEYFYRHLYQPTAGMFRALPADLALGAYVPPAAPPVALAMLPAADAADADADGFVKDGVAYRPGDCLYLAAGSLPMTAQAERELREYAAKTPSYANKGGAHKGSAQGLRAFGVAALVAVAEPLVAGGKPSSGGGARGGASSSSLKLRVRRFYRPEDLGRDAAYRAASPWELYWSAEELEVDAADVVGRCAVLPQGAPERDAAAVLDPAGAGPAVHLDAFRVVGSYAPAGAAGAGKKASAASAKKGKKGAAAAAAAEGGDAADGAAAAASVVGPPPAEYAPVDGAMDEDGAEGAAAPPARKRPLAEGPDFQTDGLGLRTMDIFAGCGGLSEGMHQARAADTRWAIEYERPAADAFALNNPHAEVFCSNCNVILRAAMDKAGLGADCEACDEAVAQARDMEPGRYAALPAPGEVEFIMGGPPCQGYSGMNRFNKSNWSTVQCSMVMAFLSYADFYRPRYFLLENVRNFVSHNKSFTFRMCLRSLLDMGYQVRVAFFLFFVCSAAAGGGLFPLCPPLLTPLLPTTTHNNNNPQQQQPTTTTNQNNNNKPRQQPPPKKNQTGPLWRAQRRQLWRAPEPQALVHLGGGADRGAPRVAQAHARVPLPAARHQPARRRALPRRPGAARRPPAHGHGARRDRRPARRRQRRGARGAALRGPARVGLPAPHPRRPGHAQGPHLQGDEPAQPGALPVHPPGRPRGGLARAAARGGRGPGARALPGAGPGAVVPAQHGRPPQRLARAVRAPRPARPLPDVDDRPAAHGQGRSGPPPGAAPHRERARVRALAGLPGLVFVLGQRALAPPAGGQRRAAAAGGRARVRAARRARGDGAAARGGGGGGERVIGDGGFEVRARWTRRILLSFCKREARFSFFFPRRRPGGFPFFPSSSERRDKTTAISTQGTGRARKF